MGTDSGAWADGKVLRIGFERPDAKNERSLASRPVSAWPRISSRMSRADSSPTLLSV